MNALDVIMTITGVPVAFMAGLALATRMWYPKLTKAQREADSSRVLLNEERNKRLEAEANRSIANTMREFHWKESEFLFDRNLKLQARIVELEKLLHGTEEALRFAQEQTVLDTARKTNAAQS